MFGQYNFCLLTWNDYLDIFVGVEYEEELIEPPRYAQSDTLWAGDPYGASGDKTIAEEGCALCVMASAMTACGDTVNPGELNRWMQDTSRTRVEGGYAGTDNVSWFAIEQHYPGLIDMTYYEKYMYIDGKLNNSGATDPSVLDDPLSNRKLVFVNVYNSDTGNPHWVEVYRKEDNRYRIIDSAGRNEEYLDAYGSFWTYVVVKKL